MSDQITSSGGLCVPMYLSGYAPLKRGDTFTVTYQVRGHIRRWWFRRTGWSTEWTVEYEYVPITDSLPLFTATRGGISF